MVESYNLETLTDNAANIFNGLMQTFFYIAITLLIIWLVINIFVWRFGASKKSEKLIKNGIRNSIMSAVLLFLTIVIPILLDIFKFMGGK